MSGEEDVEVYVYNGVDEVPWDVTHVRVDPSVTIIPQRAFLERCKLEVVELPEGLMRIEYRAFYDNVNLKRINVPSTAGLQRLGNDAFANCVSLTKLVLSEGLREIEEGGFFRCTSLISISLPSSLKDIGVGAFKYCDQLNEVRLPDSVEIIQEGAFKDCNFTNFRVSRVNNIDISILWGNKNLVSLELSTNLKTFTARGGYDAWFASISTAVLPSVRSLRNVTFPSECQVDTKVLHKYTDLGVLLLDKEGEDAILDVLKHRFDDLPIHKICYYQSYNNITPDQLNNATEVRIGQRLSKINPTGKEQDCLGMTPLHILACSTKQSVEIYHLLIEKYPETLIMKDKWGDIPLLYAFWCNSH